MGAQALRHSGPKPVRLNQDRYQLFEIVYRGAVREFRKASARRLPAFNSRFTMATLR